LIFLISSIKKVKFEKEIDKNYQNRRNKMAEEACIPEIK
jgi:hypothetical protein